ncbi:MAG: hypothetical protein M3357_13140 [Actinomycetota bacterium]|nr:hypothetical protein [Actinomycetota bacterium]
MTSEHPELEARLTELVRPTAGDVLRAKRAALARLATGEPVRSDALVHVLHDETGVPCLNGTRPLFICPRSVLSRPSTRTTPRSSTTGTCSPPNWPSPNSSPKASSFRSTLADLFTAGLETLDVDPRMRLCMAEALEAYRRGLWLSCVNLLGAVSEGAWYRAAEQLRDFSPQIDRALTDDISAARVIRVVADELARAKGLAGVAAELHSHAAYLGDLRNYGVHPRSADPAASQEHAFTEAGCSLLLLETHRYLERLAGAVDRATSAAAGSGP